MSHPSKGDRLEIATLNLGLLNHPFSKVPYYEARRKNVGEFLKNYLAEYYTDVLLLQEAWQPEDQLRIAEALEDSFYVFRHPPKYKDALGLMICLNRKSIAEPLDTGIHLLPGKWWGNARAFHEFICGYLRGAQYLECKLDKFKVHIFNLHLTPFESLWKLRQHQLKELIKFIQARSIDENDLVIIGGDFNHSTVYLNHSDAQAAEQMFQDLLTEHGFTDTTRHLKTYDPEQNQIAKLVKWGNDGKPLALDRIWIKGKASEGILEPRLFATECIESDWGPIPISDHFGVRGGIAIESLVEIANQRRFG